MRVELGRKGEAGRPNCGVKPGSDAECSDGECCSAADLMSAEVGGQDAVCLEPLAGSANGSYGTGAAERRRTIQSLYGEGVGGPQAQKSSLATAAAFDRRERLWFWQSVLENAAVSEIAVNMCLPCCVCSRSGGLWRPPSDTMLGTVVLALNLVGCFLEGFFKSTRLLSQTLRRTQLSHQLVFVSSQGFSEGFLNVLTSFPDIAGSGSDIIAGTDNVSLGVLYCLAQMLGGLVLYHLGRRAGWRCVKTHWATVVQFCRVWPLIARVVVLAAFLLTMVVGTPAQPGLAAAGAVPETPPRSGGNLTGLLPLDLSEPGLQGVYGARIVVDEFVFTVPPLALGLAVGVFMSASGAAVAAVFCSVLFAERDRPAARLITNFAATALTIWAQQVRSPAGPGLDSAATQSFVLLKIGTSFCGALSAFSGTIGDVTDAYVGSAPEESSLDKALQKKWWLPWVSAAQNLLAHFALTMVIMVVGARQEESPAGVQPIVLESTARQQHWIREREALPWQVAITPWGGPGET